MEIHIEGIREDLQAAAAALGDEKLAAAFGRLADTAEPAMRLRIIDLLSEVALRLNVQLEYGHVEVRLAGREPELVYVDEPVAADEPPAPGDDLSARITLRLPDSLKTGLEGAAAREGISTNAWIVRALARALEPRAARRSSNRLQGFARS
jgi:HicB-like protein involved in pilus formation